MMGPCLTSVAQCTGLLKVVGIGCTACPRPHAQRLSSGSPPPLPCMQLAASGGGRISLSLNLSLLPLPCPARPRPALLLLQPALALVCRLLPAWHRLHGEISGPLPQSTRRRAAIGPQSVSQSGSSHDSRISGGGRVGLPGWGRGLPHGRERGAPTSGCFIQYFILSSNTAKCKFPTFSNLLDLLYIRHPFQMHTSLGLPLALAVRVISSRALENYPSLCPPSLAPPKRPAVPTLSPCRHALLLP